MISGPGESERAVPPGRRLEIHDAVLAAVTRWDTERLDYLPDEPRIEIEGGSVLRPLPRRQFLEIGELQYGPPPMKTRARPRPGLFAGLGRFLAWSVACLRFGSGTTIDILLRRDSPQRRADRLRRTLERAGGTFLKFGQQLSIRVDLLPSVYCNELSKLLDRVEPFASDHAIEAVERAIGGPLDTVFAAFDPEPIGSASVACVYQGVLRSGERVAVKVRRPKIAKTFAADWRALDWIVRLLELLSIVRPGQLRSFLRDLETMFMEELDFEREARNADLFRRQAAKSQLDFLSAPRVHFEVLSEEVLVTEFVSGVWLWELLGAVGSGDEEALADIRARDIDPAVVGQRLFRTSLFGIFENMIFHADPHPANIVIRPGNRIALIDFGSCGSYTERQLTVIRQFHVAHAQGDVAGMVQCSLELLEPLPPVDIDALTRDGTEVYGESIRAIESPHSPWWERTSASVWLGFMQVARKYHLEVDLDVLRMIRSTLLYDTLAARLYPELDIYEEYQQYRQAMAEAARKRFHGRVRRFFTEGMDDRIYLQLEEMSTMVQRTAYRLQRAVSSPSYTFSALAGKSFYAISTFVEWLSWALGIGALGVAGVSLAHAVRGQQVDVVEAINAVGSSPFFLVPVGLLLVTTVRRVLVRFGDRET